MKRFVSFLALALMWPILRAPAWAQLTTLGVGGIAAVVIGTLITPSIVPQPSSYFNLSNQGFTNNGLQTNGGVAGAFLLPSSAPNNSMVMYVEGQIDPSLTYYENLEWALGAGSPRFGVSTNGMGNPQFFIQNSLSNISGTQWWNALAVDEGSLNPLVPVGGSGYATGAYPYTMTGSGCARDPTGVWAGGATAMVVDPGFLCSGLTPTVTGLQIPGSGARQSTGLAAPGGLAATSCVSNSPVNGEMTVTAQVAVAHGISPGMSFTLQGFSGTGFTGYGSTATPITYTALPGTSGTTLVGETTVGAGICPTSPVDTSAHEGTALGGTGGSVTAASISTTVPWNRGMTGITSHNAQHFCGVIGEYGADSSFPGAQFVSLVDDKGNPLPGAPALVPWLNQGTANFQGYVLQNTQSPSSPALVVTSMNSYALDATNPPTFNATTGFVTFTTTTSPGFIPGSEFTVSGVSPSGYNHTYVAVASTSGTTLVANPLSGPVGVPQAISNPGSYVSGGGLVSVILPGMQVWGAYSNQLQGDAVISPYQTFSSTGTGGVGTYGLTTNQIATTTFTAAGSIGATQITASATKLYQPLVVGDAISGTGFAPGTIITSLGTGTGGSGTYNINNPIVAPGLSGSLNATLAGTIGSPSAPVNLFAFGGGFYFTGAGSTNAAGGVVTPRPQTALGDFFNLIGTPVTAIAQGKSGWSGALANISMLWGTFPQAAGGAPSTTALASLCTKSTDINSFATANGLSVHSLYRLNDAGLWADSSEAMFQGYVDTASGATGVLHVVGSPQYGAFASQPTTPATVIAGPGIPGCPLNCPTVTSGSGSTYNLTWASSIAANVGSSLATVTMTAGPYKPAKPIATNPFNGYIDGDGTTGHPPTLHVTSITPLATMTGSLGNLISAGKIDNGAGESGNILTVTTIAPVPTIRYPEIAIGSLITGNGIAAGTHVTGYGTGTGLTGTYTVDTPQLVATNEAMFVSGVLPGAANDLQTDNSSVTGTLGASMWVYDGGLNITGDPLIITVSNSTAITGETVWAINQNYTPPFTSDTSLIATQTSLVPGQQIFGPGITTPVSIAALGTGTGGVGTYLLTNAASNGVGSSGSPIALNATGIQDGAAVAPGRALTIRDQGAGVTYPVTGISCSAFNSCTGAGSVAVSGTFDTSLLGGAPTAIQAQISLSSGGPPVTGCSACAWTNLSAYSATLSSGTVYNWKGQALNIPGANGPLYVSVRAANGTAYATMPSYIKVGLIFDWQGDVELNTVASNPGIGNNGGTANSYFSGLWGLSFWQSNSFNPLNTGPDISGTSPLAYAQMFPGDAFSELQGGVPISEASNVYSQLLSNAFGWPVSVLNTTVLGQTSISLAAQLMGNVVQNQTIAVANGSNTTFCSANTLCSNVSPAGPLIFTGATQTGAAITAVIDDGTGTSTPGNILTTSARSTGALEPGMTLTDTAGHISGSPTLVACTTGCGLVSGSYPAIQKWTISGSAQLVTSEAMRGDLGATPFPNYNIQSVAASGYSYVNGVFGTQFIKAGTFKVTDMTTAAVLCQDSNTFAYNVQGGNCTGSGGVTGFVNYSTGAYQINFTTAPANNHPLVASWTNIMASDLHATNNRPQGIDFFGDGTKTSGAISSMFDTAPGGVSGHVFGGGQADAAILNGDYAMGASGYTQAVSWLYGTKFPTVLPGESASTPFINMDGWRSEGLAGNVGGNPSWWRLNQWAMDSTTKSTWTGYITAGAPNGVLTLSSAAVGPMWEGEPIGVAGSPSGDYIIDLKTGTWGASGSTYDVGNCGGTNPCTATNVVAAASSGSPVAMNNSAFYLGSGPAFYAGPMNDVAVAIAAINNTIGTNLTPTNGFTGGRRVAARLAAATYGGFTSPANASDPSLDRVKADATGCDAAAAAAPCFDIGNTFAASHAGTWTTGGTVITIPGGISAANRPFVVGQAITCSPTCGTGLFITSLSVPPTASTASGAGEVGQTFTMTLGGGTLTSTSTGSAVVTAGCSGVSGTGSNCVDVAIAINTTNGTYGTAAALATCGENNLNGTAPPYRAPSGICRTNGIGSLIRSVRIGTQQSMSAGLTGSVWDDGLDSNGGFTQNSAFTCNIVSAKVVQCVKGNAYTSGVPAIGRWLTGSTFIEYGDPVVGTGRIATLMGSVGGQSLPFTAGSGYTNGTYPVTGSCTLGTSGTQPKIDITVAGGAIVDVYPSSATSALGLGVAGSCTFSLSALGAGTGGAITALTVGPSDGAGGIATYNSDSNMMGDLLYDNSGLVGNPLNSFFANHFGGYFEPGLPVRPWGNYLGAQVSG